MSEKRRGLGRGLGALIPTGPEGKRPVDVFFSDGEKGAEKGSSSEGMATTAAVDAAAIGARSTASGNVNVDVDRGSGRSGGRVSVKPIVMADRAAVADRPSVISGGGVGASAAGSVAVATEPVTAATVPNAASPTPDDRGESRVRSTSTGEVSAVGGEGAGAGGGEASDLVPVPGATFAELPTDSIRPNPRQPRTNFDDGELEELVGSIKEIGVLQPVVVRKVAGESGQYELIMGERRWRATKAAELATIPAIIRETEDGDLLRDALLENLHRSALNPLEEAAAYRQLLDDFGCTHEELADRISRSRPQISNTLRLLRLPPLVQRRVAAGVITAGHARALLGLTDGAQIERLAQRIVAEGLSVRATEEIVALGGGEEKKPAREPRAGQRSAAVDELASRLSDRFETRVRVDLGKSKGKLTVEFASVEDLNRILDLMAPEDPGLLRK